MPTYQQLASEPEWGAQFIPPVMNAGLLGPLRVFYGLGPSAVGSAGDNNHLYGRHRSFSWARVSRFCTDRGYGTTDPRDQAGNHNWYRAVDVGIQGDALYAACRRMDELVRSGACPGLAEWFGTFNGINVVGWFEGRPTTADSSHLYHLHVGVWNSFANDAATMQRIYAAIVGAGNQGGDEDMALYLVNAPGDFGVWLSNGIQRRGVGSQGEAEDWLSRGAVRIENVDLSRYGQPVGAAPVVLTPAQLEQIKGAAREGAAAGAGGPTAAQIAKAVVDLEHARLEN